MYRALRHKHVVGYIGAQGPPAAEGRRREGVALCSCCPSFPAPCTDSHYDPASSVLRIFLEYVPGGSVASLLDCFGPFSEPMASACLMA